MDSEIADRDNDDGYRSGGDEKAAGLESFTSVVDVDIKRT